MTKRKLNNYKTINFLDFYELYDKEKLHYLKRPGIYAIYCFRTSRTLFQLSFDIESGMIDDYADLVSDFFEISDQLQEEFNLYGLENFAFIIIYYGPLQKQYRKLDRLLKSWPYEIYSHIKYY